jgi:hypothetical protein
VVEPEDCIVGVADSKGVEGIEPGREFELSELVSSSFNTCILEFPGTIDCFLVVDWNEGKRMTSSFAGAVAGLDDFLARFGGSIGRVEEEEEASEAEAEFGGAAVCDDGFNEWERYCIPVSTVSI